MNSFDFLKRAFLSPLFLLDPKVCIEIYAVEDGAEEYLVKFGTPDPELPPLKKKIYFERHWVGSIEIRSSEIDSTPFLKALDDSLAKAAPTFFWNEISWEQRLLCFKVLEEVRSFSSEFNWVGIYRKDPSRLDELIVASYLGDATPHTRIPLNQGICGAAILEQKSINVPDVKADPRYLSCSLETKSELVVPLRNRSGEVFAEIDIDATKKNIFDTPLQTQIEWKAKELEEIIFRSTALG